MNTCHIITSPVMELLSSLFRLQNHVQLSQESKSQNRELDQVISDSYRSLDEECINSLAFFFHYESFFGLCLASPLYKNNVYEDVDALITFLMDSDDHFLFEQFLYTGYSPEETVDLANMEEVNDYIQKMNLPEQEKWKLTYVYVNPHETKQRFIQLIKKANDLYFNQLWHSTLHQKLKESKSDLTSNPGFVEEFMNQQTIKSKEVVLFPSFFYDAGSMESISKVMKLHLMIYGLNHPFDNHVEMDNQQVVELFKSLSDLKRIKIIQLLKTGPRYGYELAQYLSISNSTASHHLGALQSLGIIYSKRDENKVYYYLDRERSKQLLEEVQDFLL